MKFIIQTINNQVKYDFCFTLIDAIEYANWFAGSKIYEYELIELDSPMPSNCIPVGSVQFVDNYLREKYKRRLRPLNIPTELLQYAKRDIQYLNYNKIELNGRELFIKSHDFVKGFVGILKDPNDKKQIPRPASAGAPCCDGINPPHHMIPFTYMVSGVVEIESEWRGFVHKGELAGLQHYSGDFTIFPDVPLIKEMITEYKSAPVAYTLDVGISQKGTFIIEVNDFCSCGLYGFSDYKILPRMFIDWFNEYIK